MVSEDIGGQTRRCLENIEALLRAAGFELSDVVKTTVYMTDLKEFGPMNEIYAGFFQPPYPARATVEVSALPKGALVEIEACALKPETKPA
jgi:2-iminobutanoate/2-iminopropanoate deaminase